MTHTFPLDMAWGPMMLIPLLHPHPESDDLWLGSTQHCGCYVCNSGTLRYGSNGLWSEPSVVWSHNEYSLV